MSSLKTKYKVLASIGLATFTAGALTCAKNFDALSIKEPGPIMARYNLLNEELSKIVHLDSLVLERGTDVFNSKIEVLEEKVAQRNEIYHSEEFKLAKSQEDAEKALLPRKQTYSIIGGACVMFGAAIAFAAFDLSRKPPAY